MENNSNNKKNDNRGFTLVELVVVLVVIAAMAGLSAPLFQRSYASLGKRVAADGVLQTFKYARDRAVLERMQYRVNFDVPSGRYWVTRENNANGPGDFIALSESLGHSRAVQRGVHLKTEAPSVTFYPDGTASQGWVEIAAGEGDVSRIELQPALGKARIVTPGS